MGHPGSENQETSMGAVIFALSLESVASNTRIYVRHVNLCGSDFRRNRGKSTW
jgi:hypothetical protein